MLTNTKTLDPIQLFGKLPADMLYSEILFYLNPFEIENLRLINKEFKEYMDITNLYLTNNLWKKKCKRYFPQYIKKIQNTHSGSTEIDWRTEFWQVLKCEYQSLTDTEIQLYIMANEGYEDEQVRTLLQTLIFEQSNAIEYLDSKLLNIIKLARIHNQQNILDITYELVSKFFIENKFEVNELIFETSLLDLALMCKQSDKEIKKLIDEGWDVNLQNSEGMFLVCLADESNLDLFLGNKNFNINLRNENNNSAIDILIQHGQFKFAKILIDKCKPDEHTLSSALQNALHMGNFDLIHDLILQLKNQFNKTHDDLSFALKLQNIDISDSAIADNNFQMLGQVNNNALDMGLLLAFQGKSIELINFLLSKGANIHAPLPIMPLLMLLQNPNDEIFKFVIEKEKENLQEDVEAILIFALKNYQFDRVKFVLQAFDKINQNVLDKILIAACEHGTVEIVELLLNKKANIDVIITENHEPLSPLISSLKNNNHVFEKLIEEKASVNLTYVDASVLVQLAKMRSFNHEKVEYILNNVKVNQNILDRAANAAAEQLLGGDKLIFNNTSNKAKFEVLNMSFILKNKKVIENLLSDPTLKFEPDLLNEFLRYVTLIWSSPSKKIIKLLINKGANPYSKVEDGNLLMHKVFSSDRIIASRYLMELGFDVTKKNERNIPAYVYLVKESNQYKDELKSKSPDMIDTDLVKLAIIKRAEKYFNDRLNNEPTEYLSLFGSLTGYEQKQKIEAISEFLACLHSGDFSTLSPEHKKILNSRTLRESGGTREIYQDFKKYIKPTLVNNSRLNNKSNKK